MFYLRLVYFVLVVIILISFLELTRVAQRHYYYYYYRKSKRRRKNIEKNYYLLFQVPVENERLLHISLVLFFVSLFCIKLATLDFVSLFLDFFYLFLFRFFARWHCPITQKSLKNNIAKLRKYTTTATTNLHYPCAHNTDWTLSRYVLACATNK